MFPRIKIKNRQAQSAGKYIHTDPEKGPPRHDLRTLNTLPDPDLDAPDDENEPDLEWDLAPKLTTPFRDTTGNDPDLFKVGLSPSQKERKR